jgi:hypothetical protein
VVHSLSLSLSGCVCVCVCVCRNFSIFFFQCFYGFILLHLTLTLWGFLIWTESPRPTFIYFSSRWRPCVPWFFTVRFFFPLGFVRASSAGPVQAAWGLVAVAGWLFSFFCLFPAAVPSEGCTLHLFIPQCRWSSPPESGEGPVEWVEAPAGVLLLPASLPSLHF